MNLIKNNNQNGQVAIFFAVSFTFFVVLLLVVLNSMLLTSQKIKLQNTSDMSALRGAVIVKNGINNLNSANNDAEWLWRKTQIAYLNLPAYCYPGKCNLPTDCQKCKSDNNRYQEILIRNYRSERGKIYGEIEEIVKDTYKEAYKQALKIALSENRLPPDILHYMEENGGYPGFESLLNSYSSYPIKFENSETNLKELYKMLDPDDVKDIPLFTMGNGQELENESRPFIKPKFDYIYGDATCCNLLDNSCRGQPCTVSFTPRTQGAFVKVVKRTEREPRFFFGIDYQPLHSFNIFNLKWRKDKGTPWERFERPDDRKEHYDSDQLLFLKRFRMLTRSLALPVGGQMAEGFTPNTISNLLNPISRIKKIFEEATAQMHEYKKVKLVGFANDDEIGENLNTSDFFPTFKKSDDKKEDYWH